MIYLAQPYSHPSYKIRRARFKLAEYMLMHFSRVGEVVYSPIVQFHRLAELYELPTDAAFWQHNNLEMLSKANLIRILCLPGWKQSKGLDAELSFAWEKTISPQHIEYDDIHHLCYNHFDPLAETYPLRHWLDLIEEAEGEEKIGAQTL